MKLTTVQVGVPVYRLKAAVTHSIVRKPTVFERMVMRLSRRAVDNPAIGATTIRDAFERHLGVPGIPLLLDGTIRGLIRLDVLRVEDSHDTSLLDQPIHALRLTPAGEDFYTRNTLPNTPTTDAVEYLYTPWSNSLSTSRLGKLAESTPETAFSESLLRPRDPSSVVRRELEANPPRFLKRESRVIGVEADIEGDVSWLSVDLELHASEGGYLEVRAPRNKALGDWLAKLEPAIIQDTLFDGLIGRTPSGAPQLPNDILTTVSRLVLSPDGAQGSCSAVVDLSDLSDDGLTVQMSPDVYQVGWATGEAGQPIIACRKPASVPTPFASVTVAAGRPKSCTIDGELVLTWAGGLRHARVRAEVGAEAANGYGEPFSDDLAAQLAESVDPKIATVPLAWGSDRPFDELSRHLAGLPLSGVLEAAHEFIQAAKTSRQKLGDKQLARLANTVASSIDGALPSQRLGLEEIDRWLRQLRDALGSGLPLGALTRSLLAVAAPPASALEVRVLLNLEKNPQCLPEGMLSHTVLLTILEDLLRDPNGDLGAGELEVLRPLESYRAAQVSLDTTLGRQHATALRPGQPVTAARTVGHALRAAMRWLEVVDDPALAQAVGGSLPSALLQLRKAVGAWTDATTPNLVSAPQPGVEAMVFDTNSLLNHPDALRSLTGSQIGVIPNRVLQELDGLKRSRDAETARKARAANGTLDELKGLPTLRFEPARTTLIPRDLGSADEPDNQILSVAIAYSVGDVTLVTGDKNLRNKAEATSIAAKDWPSLQESRGQRR